MRASVVAGTLNPLIHVAVIMDSCKTVNPATKILPGQLKPKYILYVKSTM